MAILRTAKMVMAMMVTNVIGRLDYEGVAMTDLPMMMMMIMILMTTTAAAAFDIPLLWMQLLFCHMEQ
jgi:hypothetical protein